jgi:hypothetical protein
MRKNRYILNVAGFLALSLVSAWTAAQRFDFVAMGDAPYQTPAHFTHFERLTARVNAIRPAFTLHIGDIKSGSSRCDDALFDRMLSMFNAYEQPFVYTPGDNEWTDCHRTDNGGYDPLERLGRLRAVFFRDGRSSLGRKPLPLESQSQDARYTKFVENARWERSGVVFATAHIVGSNNNLQRDQAAVNEYIERNAANIAWIQSTFDRAATTGAKAIVLAFQADPYWDLDAREDQRSGFTDTLRAIKTGAAAFGKPVLVIHGDKHRLVIDKPAFLNRRLVYNITRLMVFGENEVQGVVVGVDPDDPDVFSFRTLTVRENVNPLR